MVGWSHLPPEIKQHVVKKLDFMSRHSLKCTSYTDRQIVNSTPLKIPRVRFGHKDGRCLIVIYTGVEQFLRWELFDDDDGVALEKSENCYDTAKFKCILIQNTDSFQIGIHILKTLLAHKFIKIDVFEWDIPCRKEDEFQEKMSNMEKYLNGDTFRATEVLAISIFDTLGFLQNYAMNFCSEVKRFNILYRDLLYENIVPLKIIEFKTLTDDKSCAAIFVIYNQVDGIELLSRDALEQHGRPTNSCLIAKEMGSFPAQQLQRSEEDGYIKLTYTTKCGKYCMTMLPEDEQLFRNQLVNMKCGMSWLCKSCADPFEYWYHQNLMMRIVLEPFWTFGLDGNGEVSAQLMKSLKQKVNKRPKPFKPSWGFKKLSLILQTTKKPSQKALRSRGMKKEMKIDRRQKLQKRWKKVDVRQEMKTGIPKFFIWFGMFFVGYIAFSFVLNLVE